MKDLTKGNIYKTFILFAIPLVLSGILSNAFGIINSVIAGKYLGADGIAATGATSQLVSFISSIFWGYATGVSVYTAVLFGSKNYEQLKTSLFSNAIIIILANIFISIVAIIFRNHIMDLLNVDPSIRSEAIKYFIIIYVGNVFIVLNMFFNFTMNALGLSEYPLRMSLISSALTITGNIISTAYLGFGVAGIATTTIIASMVVFTFYIRKLMKCFKEMGVSDYPLEFCIGTVGKSISYSLPTTMQQMIMSVSTLLLSPIINGIGSAGTAAYSISLKVYNLNASIYQNSAKTLTNYTAQTIGAEKYNNIKKGLGVGALQGIILLTPPLLLTVIFAEQICSFFFSSGFSGDALTYSVAFARFFLPLLFFNMINNLFHSFFRGTKSMGLLVFFTTFGSIVNLVASAILARKYGIYGIYGGWAISWIAEAVFIFIAYLTGMWKKPLRKKLELEGKEFNI